jgi:hypothetical protein
MTWLHILPVWPIAGLIAAVAFGAFAHAGRCLREHEADHALPVREAGE